jgi:hypothetical protein
MKKAFASVVLVLVVFSLIAAKKASLFSFQESFPNQTGDLAATTLFTPPEDTDYQACLYLENISPNTGTVQVTASWTDDRGAQSHSIAGTGSLGGCFPIHSLATTAVTLSGTDFGSSQTYTIYVTAIGQ